MNYVSYNPKRRYEDRFTGAINAFKRKYQKNGRLKFKYRPKPSELTFEEGEINNTYVSSLSKALTIDICLNESDEESVVS